MRKIITFVLIITLVIVNVNLIKGSYDSAEKLKQIDIQDDKVKGLQDQNLSLKADLKKSDSQFYIEQQARDKLGFSKSGETTVILQDQNISKSGVAKSEKPKTNLEKWLELIRN